MIKRKKKKKTVQQLVVVVDGRIGRRSGRSRWRRLKMPVRRACSVRLAADIDYSIRGGGGEKTPRVYEIILSSLRVEKGTESWRDRLGEIEEKGETKKSAKSWRNNIISDSRHAHPSNPPPPRATPPSDFHPSPDLVLIPPTLVQEDASIEMTPLFRTPLF